MFMNDENTEHVGLADSYCRFLLILSHENIEPLDFKKERGIKSQNWNNWRTRGIPDNLIFKFAKEFNVFAEWIESGDSKYAPDWLNIKTTQEKLTKEPSKIETIADLFESSVISKLSPQSQDLVEQIQKTIENNTLTDEMAAEIKGYLQIKLSKDKSNQDNGQKCNELKERLQYAQDDTHHGKDHHR